MAQHTERIITEEVRVGTPGNRLCEVVTRPRVRSMLEGVLETTKPHGLYYALAGFLGTADYLCTSGAETG